jgi:hypothetical protein
VETLKHLNLTRRGASSHYRCIGEGREGIVARMLAAAGPLALRGRVKELPPKRAWGRDGNPKTPKPHPSWYILSLSLYRRREGRDRPEC